MEILNKNQRQSAIWSLVGLGLVVLAINAVIILAIHEAYANQGSGEVDNLKKQLQAAQAIANGKGQNLNVKINELNAKIKALETEKAGFNTKYEVLKLQKDDLDRQLTRCEMRQLNSN